MDDLISRQAAIDALEEPCKVSDTWSDECAVGKREQWEKDVKSLKVLPSAQPELTEEDVMEYCDKRNFAVIPRESLEMLKWWWNEGR